LNNDTTDEELRNEAFDNYLKWAASYGGTPPPGYGEPRERVHRMRFNLRDIFWLVGCGVRLGVHSAYAQASNGRVPMLRFVL